MTNPSNKKKNYDYTAAERMRNRDSRIKEVGLSNLKVVMHKDDADTVREFARNLYEKRGVILD